MKKNFIVYSPVADAWSDVVSENDERDAIKCLENGGWLDHRDRELMVYELTNSKTYINQPAWVKKGKSDV